MVSSPPGRGSILTTGPENGVHYKDRQIALLQQKLQRKHEVLSELMEEHIKLKKELGEL